MTPMCRCHRRSYQTVFLLSGAGTVVPQPAQLSVINMTPRCRCHRASCQTVSFLSSAASSTASAATTPRCRRLVVTCQSCQILFLLSGAGIFAASAAVSNKYDSKESLSQGSLVKQCPFFSVPVVSKQRRCQ